jgi:N-acetylneuraminic acid mutarotase
MGPRRTNAPAEGRPRRGRHGRSHLCPRRHRPGRSAGARRKLYVIGGRSGPEDFGAVDIFDPQTNAWTAGPAIEPRGTAGAVVRCGAIHVFGGESQAQQRTLADVLRLDPSGGWQPLASMPTARNFARAVIFRDAVHVVGGSLTPQTSHAPEGSAIVERMAPGCP